MMRALLNQLSSLLLALLLAGIIWYVATAEENPSRGGVIEGVPVQVVNLPDGMVVLQQSSSTVKFQVRAPVVSWGQLSGNSFRVSADLRGLDQGLHEVPVKWQVADPQVIVEDVQPKAIGIRLDVLKTRGFDVRAQMLDDVPVGFSAKPPVAVPAQVTVSGAGVLVDQVNDVVADVFLRGAKAPFDREVPLVARDAQGNAIKGVTITPSAVTVSVQIEQRVGYRDVSVKATLKGVPAPGYWVSNIAVNPSTVTAVGSADALGRLPGYIETMPIDVTSATSDVVKRTAFSLPDGVSVLNSEGVTVQISVTPIMGGQTVRRQVIVQGLRPGLKASVSPDQVDVILSGPVPTLQDLQPTDVQVIADVTDKGTGTYQIKPRVPIVPDALRVQSVVPDTVLVTITEVKALATPTFPLTPTLTIFSVFPTAAIQTPTKTLTASIPISQTFPTPTKSR